MLLILLLNPKVVLLENATLLIIHKAGKHLSLARQSSAQQGVGAVGTFLSVKSAVLTQKHPRNRSVALEDVNLTLLPNWNPYLI